MNMFLLGSQWAFGILVVVVWFIGGLIVGVNAGQMVERKERGEVQNGWACVFTWAFTQGFLMYATLPVIIALIKWAAKVVKGG